MPTAAPLPPDPIEHVIVLMLENRSFDHMLGGLSEVIDGLDGVPKAGGPQRSNRADGKSKQPEQVGSLNMTQCTNLSMP